ncbi:hypothetical protein [Phocaeicola sartorii]|uniref:hypothetical protein n=1 Tax=Phocaeicola sartorii TaxID=671267 RepID=UPI003F68C1E0
MKNRISHPCYPTAMNPVMLEKLITETEKEIQAVKDAERRKDLQGLDALIHHLRSSWRYYVQTSR